GVARKMFDVLAREKINIQMISTSEIKVSCVVDAAGTDRAVRALHTAFGLDAPARGTPRVTEAAALRPGPRKPAAAARKPAKAATGKGRRRG
ncbi:MAG: hypothetical protein RL653_1789, partial [Pseudomonadota bacterium]